MRRPRSGPAPAPATFLGPRRGFTLVEMLVATALTLLMMAAAVQIFGLVGASVSDSRATLEMNERVRAAVRRLQMDLESVTAPMLPPLSPAADPGYFEYVEGPVLTETVSGIAADSSSGTTTPDTTVIDFDDIVMFTTRSPDRPFVGRLNGNVVESQVAEVAWFVRGGNLYRRVLLVMPSANLAGATAAGFYQNNDISVRRGSGTTVVPNTLGDLTRRENRYAHPGAYPFDVRAWGYYGLPSLAETSAPGWTVGQGPGSVMPSFTTPVDFWTDPQPRDGTLAGPGSRVYEDVILNHVIGFDVKAWDPQAPLYGRSGATVGYGAYVDLGIGRFSVTNPKSGLQATYDTWSTSYEHDPSMGAGRISNGFDDNNDGAVDNAWVMIDTNGDGIPDTDPGENVTGPPYYLPLRGIQVKIRVFEPDSRQVREVTLVQDFMQK